MRSLRINSFQGKTFKAGTIMETYLIAGLGNPDRKYENTRHNSGFAAVDMLAASLGITIAEEKFRGKIGIAYKGGKKYVLLKPMTYMNLSGESLQPAAAYYDIPADHIIVLYDDINLQPGHLRVRPKGSAGGHNGMKSIIACLGTDQFPRVRIGVGINEIRTEDGEVIRTDLAHHVLAKFTPEEKKELEAVFKKAGEAAIVIAEEGPDAAMNKFNC